MYRASLYATLVLVLALPAGIASAGSLRSYHEAPGGPDIAPVTVGAYIDQKVSEIDQVVASPVAKPEKIRRIREIVTQVENFRRSHRVGTGFDEYTADLRIKPYELIPSEKELGQKTCLQAKDRVMLNYDPTVDNYNTNVAPLRNVLKVIDRICS